MARAAIHSPCRTVPEDLFFQPGDGDLTSTEIVDLIVVHGVPSSSVGGHAVGLNVGAELREGA